MKIQHVKITGVAVIPMDKHTIVFKEGASLLIRRPIFVNYRKLRINFETSTRAARALKKITDHFAKLFPTISKLKE
jgi:hypothetical protein